ncbi:MAG: D-2-hydroxyacid dehydrogenase [Burkholderiales bacterium]|nr:D-2-hydroxyacid dehydrogenase [Burkholderiales bacterium]
MTENARPLALLWTENPATYREAAQRAGLGERVEFAEIHRDQLPGEELLARADLLVCWPPPAGLLARMPRLVWIQTPSAGVEGWLARSDLREGITLTCARGIHRVQMPENILGALFHITKHYAEHVASQRERRWRRVVSEPLAGKTLGILGVGAIGAELARKAAALELRVIGVRQSGAAVPHVERVYPPRAMDEVLRQADFVLLLLPLTAQTEHLMNTQRLSAMKPSAWLLNFARGALIVDADLIEAVRTGVIAGAVLDAFREEPLPASHPFWTTEGILVLPHIGGGHPQRDRIVAELFAQNLRRFVCGEPLSMAVDRAKGY